MVYWFDDILDLTQTKSVLSTTCFDENTVLRTINGEKLIKDIQPGDMLVDGDQVTAVFKLSSAGEIMYNYEGIIVSGSHKILTPLGRCLSVADHPKSKSIDNYCKPYLYCLSTMSKTIKIGNHFFSDWDEVDYFDWENIKNRMVSHLPNNSQSGDIHTYLDSGFSGMTLIELLNGKYVPLQDISVGDRLKNGEKVLGIVCIDATNLSSIKRYNIKGEDIICSPNILFIDNDLGNMTTLKLNGKDLFGQNRLYHLITDTNFFTIKDIIFYDYNGFIEKMIEGHELLFPSF